MDHKCLLSLAHTQTIKGYLCILVIHIPLGLEMKGLVAGTQMSVDILSINGLLLMRPLFRTIPRACELFGQLYSSIVHDLAITIRQARLKIALRRLTLIWFTLSLFHPKSKTRRLQSNPTLDKVTPSKTIASGYLPFCRRFKSGLAE